MENSSTKKYAFILGRERELALAELKAVLGRFCFDGEPSRTHFDFSILSVYENIAIIKIDSEASESAVSSLAKTLGGTVKIFRIMNHESRITDSFSIKKAMADFIFERKEEGGKLNYGISSYFKGYNRTFVNNLGLSIKKELKRDMSLRFVALTEGIELSSIQSLKNKLDCEGLEFGLFNNEIGVLIGLSNAEEWSKRDYDKPAGDKYSGMVPPKLARAMVNLALGKIQVASSKGPHFAEATRGKQVAREIENPCDSLLATRSLVVDPFCGSGNILMEAMMLGCDVFGSDNSAKAVEDTEANLRWLNDKFLIPNVKQNVKAKSPKFKVLNADATGEELIRNLKLEIRNYDDTVIVAEPYLGSPKKFQSTEKAVRGEYAKIKELYLSFLENLKKLLATDHRPPTIFCLVFPLVETLEGKRFSLFAECVDEIKKMGYILLEPPFMYGRDYQVVKRQIVLLSLNS